MLFGPKRLAVVLLDQQLAVVLVILLPVTHLTKLKLRNFNDHVAS
jgi:hypothetical protein